MLAVLQKGTAVALPLGTSAPIVGTSAGSGPYFNTTAAGGAGTHTFLGNNASNPLNQSAIPATADLWKWGTTVGDVGLTADLSAATSASINTLRQSITLQQFLENDARGGTRYTEIVRSRWGVISPDARLQRTEILGLHSNPVQIHPVANTATSATPSATTGALGAFGTSVDIADGFTKSFTEHGVIIGLMNVRADLTYAQGLERVWSYRTRYDFFNPEFANLGEQAVLNKEIMADCPDGTGTGQKGRCVWISGAIWGRALFQVDGYWTYAAGCDRHFGGLESYGAFSSIPTLGSTFIQSNVPLDQLLRCRLNRILLRMFILRKSGRV